MKKLLLTSMLLVLMVFPACAGILDELKTPWESSYTGYEQLYDEGTVTALIDFVKTVANNSGGRIRYETMGHTVLGTPMPLLVVGFPNAPKNPTEVGDRIVLFFLGSMHGSEGEGTEGQLIFLREIAQGKHDELLKNVALLICPAYNPDGLNAVRRQTELNFDPNRDFSKMDTLETKALFKQLRKWDPSMLIDQHLAGSGANATQGFRHVMMYTIGKSGNNDPELHIANQNFADSVFALGKTKYGEAAQSTNFFRKYMREFFDKATVPLLTGTGGALPSDVSHNSRISLSAMPYMNMGSYMYGDANGRKELVRMTHTNDDNVRTTFAYMTAKNRFGILYEVPGTLSYLLRVHSHYASAVSTVDQAGKQKDEILAFLKKKDNEMKDRENTNGVNLYIGALKPSLTAGNAGVSSLFAKNPHDFGWGPGVFKIESYAVSGDNTLIRDRDEVHYPEVWNYNAPQTPTQMGAFYIIDSRAEKAAMGLLRHGIKLFRLKQDLALPADETVKFYDPNETDGNWGVTRQEAYYEGHYATRVTSGDWNQMPDGYVAKEGAYVFSSAQPHGRFASYWVEPKASCGAFLWNFMDEALIRGGNTWTQASFDIVKTYNYLAVPDSALLPVSLAEDENNKPAYTFTPSNSGTDLPDAEATVTEAGQSQDGAEVIISIKDSSLHDEMWLTFFFYEEGTGKHFDVLGQVTELEPGLCKVVFMYDELTKAGLAPGRKYAVQYINDWGDIFGYGTFTKGVLELKNS